MHDLYTQGDGEAPHVADYPGSVLKIYKRTFNKLPWPLWQLLIVKERKILYNPIAKCGSSSLRSMIVNMSNLSSSVKNLPLDTHSTGLQLGDMPLDEAEDILHDRAYFRFAVIRNPLDRLVSAYLEKFVSNRMDRGNQFHTRKVIAQAHGVTEPVEAHFHESITFSQFIDYIAGQNPAELDPHWCPQHLYLGTTVYKLFRLDHLEELYGRLGIGEATRSDRQNTTRKAPTELPGAYSHPARMLQGVDITTSSFYNEALFRKVREYFALDFSIFNALA